MSNTYEQRCHDDGEQDCRHEQINIDKKARIDELTRMIVYANGLGVMAAVVGDPRQQEEAQRIYREAKNEIDRLILIKENEIKTIPEGNAVCPCCHGSTRRPSPKNTGKYIATYDAETDTLACDNCGGQTMSLTAVGYTEKRTPNDAEGCKHEYTGRQAGNCYWIYTCKHCRSSYGIDSSD